MTLGSLALALALSPSAMALEVFEVGDDSNEVTGDEAYKLNKYLVHEDVHLARFSQYLDGVQDPFGVTFTVYEMTAPDHYELMWDSGLVEVAPGLGWKESPPVNLDLLDGTVYLIGFYLSQDDMTYFYGPSGGDLGWADQVGLVSAENNTINDGIPLNIIEDSTTVDTAYWQRIGLEGAADADGDGVAEGEDCDDENAEVYPGHDEWCDAVDNDCNGQVDDNVVTVSWFPDGDGDGYGDTSGAESDCLGGEAPAGSVDEGGDCDDANAGIHPGAREECDGIDQDCNGQIDDGLPGTQLWQDADGDGFGDGSDPSIVDCAGPVTGYVANDDDCDDFSAVIYPGAAEFCDGADDDCDGVIPDDEADADQDGELACLDCDDLNPDPCPGAANFDDEIILVSGCSCDVSAPGAGSGSLVALLGLLALRRRR